MKRFMVIMVTGLLGSDALGSSSIKPEQVH